MGRLCSLSVTQRMALSLNCVQDNEPPCLPESLPGINLYWRELSTQVLQHPPLCFVVTHYGYAAARGELAACEGELEASARQL